MVIAVPMVANASEDSISNTQIGDTTVIPRDELEDTGGTEHGPTYRCPRCGYSVVSEYCDCPDCGWAGMCQEEFQ